MKGFSKLPLKPFDFVAVALSVILTLGSALYIYAKPNNKVEVVIQGSGKVWVYPIDAEEKLEVAGPLGTTVIRISSGEVWFEDSPCDNKTCVGSGHIHEFGQWVACLPNNVFAVIEGGENDSKLDSYTW